MAMERIERRLRQVTAALDVAGIRYAVVGGNAVAIWVAKADPAATRTTKDIDILITRDDLHRSLGVLGQLDRVSPDVKPCTERLIIAGEKVRPSYAHPTPSVTESVRDPEGFWVLDLPALLRMKLTSMHDVDRVHVADLLRVGMIDEPIRSALPADLRNRLEEIEHSIEDDDAW